MDATTVAVDLAKDIFEVALANRAGRVVERKRLTRVQFARFIDGLDAGDRGRLKRQTYLPDEMLSGKPDQGVTGRTGVEQGR